MRTFLQVTILVLVALSDSMAQQPTSWHRALPGLYGPPSHGWELALLSQKQSTFLGEPVLLQIVARNGTGQRVRLQTHKSVREKGEFVIKRVDNNTTLTPRIKDEEYRRMPRDVGSVFHYIEAGSVVHLGSVVNLRDILDLPPGTYAVTAIYQLPDPISRSYVRVTSNPIMISIVQRP